MHPSNGSSQLDICTRDAPFGRRDRRQRPFIVECWKPGCDLENVVAVLLPGHLSLRVLPADRAGRCSAAGADHDALVG